MTQEKAEQNIDRGVPEELEERFLWESDLGRAKAHRNRR